MDPSRRQLLQGGGHAEAGHVGFSEELGLYDPKTGCGFNWSDTVVVGEKPGYRMSRVPYSEEWCWLKL